MVASQVTVACEPLTVNSTLVAATSLVPIQTSIEYLPPGCPTFGVPVSDTESSAEGIAPVGVGVGLAESDPLGLGDAEESAASAAEAVARRKTDTAPAPVTSGFRTDRDSTLLTFPRTHRIAADGARATFVLSQTSQNKVMPPCKR